MRQIGFTSQNNGFVDLGFSGALFTWARGRTKVTRKQARLDRGVCLPNWSSLFQEASVKHLIKHQPNHSPIFISLFKGGEVMQGEKPFCFQAAWLTHEELELRGFSQPLFQEEEPMGKNRRTRTESIRDGDRNIGYYHLSTIIRYCANKIEALKDKEARVPHSKYCKNRYDLYMFEERLDLLNAWRGILNSKNLILKGSHMVIGNGKRTLFWYHKWCCEHPFMNWLLHLLLKRYWMLQSTRCGAGRESGDGTGLKIFFRRILPILFGPYLLLTRMRPMILLSGWGT
ncbi:hypothetical protein Cgig2_003240 [Carnegiea gigantea]|uniref:Uncharacterized protein n=1 Tax=Carnegiea gigantea TaxID=171969 RepID=A0A9Q1Q6I6_9CARY|nr:hypothetical protein Cgig2_003240 [Carnegiea gigantea]